MTAASAGMHQTGIALAVKHESGCGPFETASTTMRYIVAACQLNTTPETVPKWVQRFERLVKVSDLTRPRVPSTSSRQVEGEMQ